MREKLKKLKAWIKKILKLDNLPNTPPDGG